MTLKKLLIYLCIWGAGFIFFLLAGSSFKKAYDLRRQIELSQTWPSTLATITKSEPMNYVVTYREKDRKSLTKKTYFLANIEYQYQVGRKGYKSNRVFLDSNFPKDIVVFYDQEKRVNELIKAYPVGSQTTVYYPPEHPKNGVLRREAPSQMPEWIIGICFLLGGIIFCIPGSLIHYRASKGERAKRVKMVDKNKE